MVTITTVAGIDELAGILTLQRANIKSNITETEADSQGFVTAQYDVDFLNAMHKESPSIIAKDGDKVVGYALVTTKKTMPNHPLLNDLFIVLEKIEYKGTCLQQVNYVVVGQLCVAKDYRGMGLVQKMYGHFRETFATVFQCCITEVVRNNPISLKAHLKTGFTIINSLSYGEAKWDIVLWDWQAEEQFKSSVETY